jgi:foldase protein PrsA
MNDKLKGLLAGLTIGVMLTGSVAYASGTQIEVVFKNLKYMFDGKEVIAPEGQAGFIYEGSTYVPLRFVSEALGKEVSMDEDTGTIWVGKKPSEVIATYDGGQVTTGQLDKFLAINALFNPQSKQQEGDPAYTASMLNQLVGYMVMHSRADKATLDEVAASVPVQLAKIKGSSGGQFAKALTASGLNEADINQYIDWVLTFDKVLRAGLDDSALEKLYDSRVAASPGYATQASVRHVLIGFQDAAGKSRTKEDALKLAKEVKAKLDAGESFAAIAKQYSEDPGSKDNGGLYENAPVRDWVEPFRNAAVQLDLNIISEPVETDYGYHIMKVEARSTLSFDLLSKEAKDSMINEELNNKYQKLMQEEIPSLIQSSKLDQ